MAINWQQLSVMVGPALQQQLRQLPPEAQRAIRETGVYVTQDGNFIDVDARFKEGDSDAEKARDILLKALMDAIPQVIKMFGCRVFTRTMKS